MKITTRLSGTDSPSRLARRLENRLETGSPSRLEGRFKDGWLRDGRDRTIGPRPDASHTGGGDLRRAPRAEPRATRNRT